MLEVEPTGQHSPLTRQPEVAETALTLKDFTSSVGREKDSYIKKNKEFQKVSLSQLVALGSGCRRYGY